MTDDQWADALVLELLPPGAGLQDPQRLRPLIRDAIGTAYRAGKAEGVEEVKAELARARDGTQEAGEAPGS